MWKFWFENEVNSNFGANGPYAFGANGLTGPFAKKKLSKTVKDGDLINACKAAADQYNIIKPNQTHCFKAVFTVLYWWYPITVNKTSKLQLSIMIMTWFYEKWKKHPHIPNWVGCFAQNNFVLKFIFERHTYPRTKYPRVGGKWCNIN